MEINAICRPKNEYYSLYGDNNSNICVGINDYHNLYIYCVFENVQIGIGYSLIHTTSVFSYYCFSNRRRSNNCRRLDSGRNNNIIGKKTKYDLLETTTILLRRRQRATTTARARRCWLTATRQRHDRPDRTPGNGADRPGRIATAVPVRHDAGVHRRPVQLARLGRSSHETRAGRPVHRRRSGRLGRSAHMHGHVLLDEQRARRRRRREYYFVFFIILY